MSKFLLKDKSYDFAVNIIKFCRHLQDRREFVISKQLLRSGTAIGALVREAEFGESRADFSHKLSIALKEANETQYWLSLVKDTSCTDNNSDLAKLQTDCNELIAILVSIVKKTKPSRLNS
jgi:four helix bundle protein